MKTSLISQGYMIIATRVVLLEERLCYIRFIKVLFFCYHFSLLFFIYVYNRRALLAILC